ncbi:gluconeogenesis factor YvcK family protein [Nakamurella leprariae]|uniref:Putative gluconeogenesis factor n=1 Tax=Nakamurella leprariae TaxID=2803911 RepID=A0A938Y5B1_9ACTN|nr:uridine diphosphate-N-acetylglucosamine-binding protein YvcK [Nakamurella leprariae]MBM9466050.1 uridine diphosphate-N-acetylglucosamine-binding protein YvcK [Nakamurella leprariae]
MTAPDRAEPERPRPRVVALGGGHGLAVILQALTTLDVDVTAVVTVADDGGSSGRLRREFPGLLPPGDLRMALAAMSGPQASEQTWSTVFQHRFSGTGALTGHPVGNLLLTGLTEVLHDPVTVLRVAGELVGARGRVLPMSCVPLEIVADVTGLDTDPDAVRQIRGQVAVAATPGTVQAVGIDPPDAPACPEALEALAGADLITLGPGSWFTSVLVHLLLPELATAITTSPARRVLVLNLAEQAGETEGFSPEQHLEVIADHAPDLRVSTVLADTSAVPLPGRLDEAAHRLGARLVLDDVAMPGEPRHRVDALAAALARELDGAEPH